MRDVYMGLWLEILRKSGYVKEFGVKFEYDQFWPNKKENGKKEKRKKKKPKLDGARRNKWKYLLYDFDENIMWEFEIEKS